MRDPSGNEKRYQEYFDRRIRLAQALAKDAAAMPLDVKVNIAASDYPEIQKSVVWHYAAGMPLAQLTALAQDSVAELSASTAFLREQGRVVNEVFATIAPIRGNDRVCFGFAAIALLVLPTSAQCEAVGALVYQRPELRGALLELLLKAFAPGFAQAKKYPDDALAARWSAPVLRALALAPEQRAAALAAHMTHWCRLMRPLGWKPDLDTASGADPMFSDFAFEVALAVCAYDVDDANLRAHPYSPSGLVDYYRAHVRDTRDAWRAPHAGAGVAVQAPPLPAKADLAKSKRKGVARWIELACDCDVDATEAVLEAAGNPRKLNDSAAVLEALAGHKLAILADLRDDDSVAQACALLAEARGLGQFEAPPAPPAGLTRCEATLDAFGPWLQAKGYRLLDLEPDDDVWALLVVRELVCQEFIDLGAALALPFAPAPR